MHELSLQEELFGKRCPLPQGPFLPVRQMRTNTWPAPVTRLSVLLFPGLAAQRHSAELSEGLQSRRSQGGASSPGREHVTSKGYLGESGVQAPAPNLEEGGKEERREALREKMKLRPAWAWMTSPFPPGDGAGNPVSHPSARVSRQQRGNQVCRNQTLP